MDMLSKSFTYFKEAAGIKKDIGLSNLRNHRIVVASFEEKGSYTRQAIRRGEWIFLCKSMS
jgi:hypothetical protein